MKKEELDKKKVKPLTKEQINKLKADKAEAMGKLIQKKDNEV